MSVKRVTTVPTERKRLVQYEEDSDAFLDRKPPIFSRSHNERDNDELPKGWRRVAVRAVANSIQYGHTASAIDRKKGPRFLRITDIQDGGVDWSAVPSCDIPEEDIPKYRLAAGDIVFARTGATTGKSFLIRECPVAVFASYLIRVRVSADVDSRYLSAFFQSPDYWQQIESGKRGIGQPNVNGRVLGEVQFPLAPLDEQHQIVAEIEKQFTRLEAGLASLRRVQANLKRYRAAVLKAACEGTLVPTEAELAKEREKVAAASRRWSSDDQRRLDASATISEEIAGADENQSRDGSATQEGLGYETGAQLLERILIERRRKWSGKGKYKEPARPDTTNLPALSEGWAWTTMEQITHLVTSGSRGWSKYYSDTGPRFIRAQDINTDSLDTSSVARVTIPKNVEGTRSYVESGDLLITITGANVTKSAIVRALTEPAYVSQHVALLKLAHRDLSIFVYLWVVSPAHGRKILEKWAYGAGKPGLSLEQVRTLCVGLPPLAEQQRIVAEVERRLSIVEELEAVVNANLQRASRLRQSILHRAFTGGLGSGSRSDGGRTAQNEGVSDGAA